MLREHGKRHRAGRERGPRRGACGCRAEVAARWNFETSVRTGGTTTPRPDPLPAKPRPTKAGTAPGVLVAFPPKSDTGQARENKIDDVSAVLRYGVVSTTSELREHGRATPYPRVVE